MPVYIIGPAGLLHHLMDLAQIWTKVSLGPAMKTMQSDFENVAPFGHKLGLNLTLLAQCGQICSLKGRDLKFTLKEHFSKL